jgi:hypothetical protein
VPPIPSQASQQWPRQRHAAILGSLAVADPDEQPLGIDVGRLEPESFAEAQAEMRRTGWRTVDSSRRTSVVLSTVGSIRGLLTRSSSKTGQSRPRVWVQKKRIAQTATLMLDGACFFSSRRNRK